MAKVIPERKNVPASDCWDLSKLYADDKAWEEGFKALGKIKDKVGEFKGRLGESAQNLLDCLIFGDEIGLLEERLGYYAHLRTSEDGASSEHQARMGRYMSVATEIGAASSYIVPEVQAIDEEQMDAYLKDQLLKPYRFTLQKIIRQKPHFLSEREERLLAMQAEMCQTAQKAFSSLTNVDMDFGKIPTQDGLQPLTQSTYGVFMENTDRDVRRKAYKKFMKNFDKHKHTLSDLYAGSVQKDVYYARIRNYKSAREMSLFRDDVPVSVYDNLISSVHANLPALHRYYEIRRRALNVDALRLYDTRVPLVADVKMHHTYEEAVELILGSLKPLGDAYGETLREGLLGRWVDRYENKGKRSGAFSAGSYVGDPYILMNFKEDSFNDVFTLTHEAGHSMHSWYSVKHNSFDEYNYTIFVAEVASTFNEQLLARHLMETSSDENFKTYLINKQIDDIIGTIYRQTMFAEFEKLSHEMVEKGQVLTPDAIKKLYRKLLKSFYGKSVKLEKESSLEALRIPHFYSAFYVYKYATGLSAAISLANRVLDGGQSELNQYLSFLKTGGSKFPLDQLKEAGVDMSSPTPINDALAQFSSLVDQLDARV